MSHYAHETRPNRLFRSMERLAEYVIDGNLDPAGVRELDAGRLSPLSPWDYADFLVFCRDLDPWSIT